MTKTLRLEILLVLLTLLSLGAGLAAGLLTSRLPGSAAAAPEPATLLEDLELSPEQRQQMQRIWEQTQGQVRQSYRDAQNLQKERDDALVALLNEAQKAQFEQIAARFAGRYAELTDARNKAFSSAVEQTKTLLSEPQRTKYEHILKAQVGAAMPEGQ